jgi:hypothetical protein
MTAGTTIRGVGLGCSSPLAPTIRVGSSQGAPFHVRIPALPRVGGAWLTCPFGSDPEPPDLNVQIRHAQGLFVTAAVTIVTNAGRRAARQHGAGG